MFEIERTDAAVRLSGRFDASQVEKAKGVFAGLDASTQVDCSALDYISSAGISVLLTAHKRLQDAGHTLRLLHVSQRIQNVFRYAGLDRVFQLD